MEFNVNQNNNDQDVKITKTENAPAKEQEKQEALLDFSSMFKKNGFAKRPMPKLGAERKAQTQSPNWLLQIPAKLEITTQDFQQRRFMNQQKWAIMTKVNNHLDSPIAAVLSSINYLVKAHFSENLTVFKLKDFKEKLQKSDTFTKQLTRRQVILQCIRLITEENKINLDVKIHELFEQGKNRQFLTHKVQVLKNNKKALIYVSYNHVFCPIGFDNTPLVPLDAYKKLHEIQHQKMEFWFILASTLKSQAPFVIKRWNDIEKQMICRWPQYLDLEQAKKGIQTWENSEQIQTQKNQQVSCWIQLTLTQINS